MVAKIFDSNYNVLKYENEYEILKTLSKFWHPNIGRYLGRTINNDDINNKFRIFLYEHGYNFFTLKSYVTHVLKGKSMHEVYIGLFINQILLGLQHLHGLNIIHGNLNGDSVIVTKKRDGSLCCKLHDFTHSKSIDEISGVY